MELNTEGGVAEGSLEDHHLLLLWSTGKVPPELGEGLILSDLGEAEEVEQIVPKKLQYSFGISAGTDPGLLFMLLVSLHHDMTDVVHNERCL